MFYCQPCGQQRGWPETLARSTGRCEVCGAHSLCFDCPSSALPLPSPVMTPAQPPVTDSYEDLPPTQSLVLEVLAARYRLGEQSWTFATRHMTALLALEHRGLIQKKPGSAPHSVTTALTTAGRAAALSAEYQPPAPEQPGDDGLTAAERATLAERFFRTAGARLATPDDRVLTPLFGRRVRVTLAHAPEFTVAEGILLGYGEGGDVQLAGDDGFVHHCWPRLAVTEVTSEPAAT